MSNVANIIRIYDSNRKRVAYLENAYDIGYEMNLNSLWYANFTLPSKDPKNAFIEPFGYAEIFDNGKRIELFRIMPSKLTKNTKGDIVYRCEHVLATLLDDVLFQYHQVGNIGVDTTQVMRYVLDRQTIKNWQLGTVGFNRQFEYKWENENLLAALFSVAKPFDVDYKWEFNTEGYPWRLNLLPLDTSFKGDVTYRKNMLQIEKEVDPSTVVTRLYCLGYGEGDNQLDISSVNNGLPYLQANTNKYGIKASILVDRRFESQETLKAYGQKLLNELKEPYKSYKIDALDLHRLDNFKYAEFRVGDRVRIIDKEDNIIEDLPIVSIKKGNLIGDPARVVIDIANKPRDVAGSISELADRTRINEVYAQGATNLVSINYNDNADRQNPAVLRVFIPQEMARINKLILNYQLEPFRAFSRAISGGGAFSNTTSGGGGIATSTASGGGVGTTTGSGGGTFTGTFTAKEVISIGTYVFRFPVLFIDNSSIGFGPEPHGHGIPDHGHRVTVNGHTHDINIPNHTHSINIPNHTHNLNVPAHNHGFNVPNHTHQIEFGIFQGGTAQSATLRVDGTNVNVTDREVDLIPYLSKDGGGRVRRGIWHTIEIIPTSLTRITANIFMQIFTNSRGGGDF